VSRRVRGHRPGVGQQPFDGRWSVLLETQKGECDKAYRYPVAVDMSLRVGQGYPEAVPQPG
jgi:hypothetical protein